MSVVIPKTPSNSPKPKPNPAQFSIILFPKGIISWSPNSTMLVFRIKRENRIWKSSERGIAPIPPPSAPYSHKNTQLTPKPPQNSPKTTQIWLKFPMFYFQKATESRKAAGMGGGEPTNEGIIKLLDIVRDFRSFFPNFSASQGVFRGRKIPEKAASGWKWHRWRQLLRKRRIWSEGKDLGGERRIWGWRKILGWDVKDFGWDRREFWVGLEGF